MEKYCPGCACTLRGLRTWCPACRRLTVGWLHIAVVAALDAAALVFLLKLV